MFYSTRRLQFDVRILLGSRVRNEPVLNRLSFDHIKDSYRSKLRMDFPCWLACSGEEGVHEVIVGEDVTAGGHVDSTQKNWLHDEGEKSSLYS